MSIWDILAKYRSELLFGLGVTLKLCLWVWGVGLVAGAALGMGGNRWKWALGVPAKVCSFILSGVPVLVFLFWLHYPFQTLLGVVIDPFWTSVAALSIVNTFLVADLTRGVLADFPTQYLMAARVYGLSSAQTVRRIQLPIVLRQMIPSLLQLQVTMLQATLFASLISVDEVFRIAQRINSEVYRPVEIYTALAVIFLLVCLPMHGLALWLRARYTRNLSDR